MSTNIWILSADGTQQNYFPALLCSISPLMHVDGLDWVAVDLRLRGRPARRIYQRDFQMKADKAKTQVLLCEPSSCVYDLTIFAQVFAQWDEIVLLPQEDREAVHNSESIRRLREAHISAMAAAEAQQNEYNQMSAQVRIVFSVICRIDV